MFLPQIILLFLLLGFLEDSGYMARAAYLMDRIMKTLGLHGRAFVPMLSGCACAIPAIMATRTIRSPQDRMTTIFVAPFMSCSARLPVYALVTAAFFPNPVRAGFVVFAGGVQKTGQVIEAQSAGGVVSIEFLLGFGGVGVGFVGGVKLVTRSSGEGFVKGDQGVVNPAEFEPCSSQQVESDAGLRVVVNESSQTIFE